MKHIPFSLDEVSIYVGEDILAELLENPWILVLIGIVTAAAIFGIAAFTKKKKNKENRK